MSSPQRSQKAIDVSVIVPVFNEESVLPEFHKRLISALNIINESSEVIYVNDGSTDNTVEVINSFKITCVNELLINLSRNFGKEAAMCAGLSRASGEVVILIDADLQDPPELIPLMISKWKNGFDIVNMQRSLRRGESWFKKFSASMFYKTFNKLSDYHIPADVGDFRLLSRRVVNELNQLSEKNVYMKGLLVWPGFEQVTLQFERDKRWCGESKWPFLKLVGLAVDGITSFSTKPLQLATYLGGALAFTSFLCGVWVILKTIFFGEAVTGFPTIMVAMLALGGFQLLSIGLIGSYVGRIYNEVKNRPRFIIKDEVLSEAKESSVTRVEFPVKQIKG
jgi:polyisoprenyl-phosphate glycosyltransferase